MSRLTALVLKLAVVAVVIAAISVKTVAWTQAADEPKSDSQVKALQQERLLILQKCYDLSIQIYDRGDLPYDKVQAAHLALLNGKLDLCETNAERSKVHKESIKVNETLVSSMRKLAEAKEATHLDVLKAEVGLLDAWISLEKAKAAK